MKLPSQMAHTIPQLRFAQTNSTAPELKNRFLGLSAFLEMVTGLLKTQNWFYSILKIKS
jgi:hypothetical protein